MGKGDGSLLWILIAKNVTAEFFQKVEQADFHGLPQKQIALN